MIELSTFLRKNDVVIDCIAESKKQLLELVAAKAEPVLGLQCDEIVRVLMEREKLGSTGLGNGIAIPHGKLAELGGVNGLFFRFKKPVPFDAIDDQPVDLVCALFAPQSAGSEHLKALSRIARTLRDETTVNNIRKASSSEEIYTILCQDEQSEAA